ncbi:MAG: hypothetical protein O9972_12230 [Burkholderiales bacterium]|nr:hypothetical protein [Burkholderiales bacterium]
MKRPAGTFAVLDGRAVVSLAAGEARFVIEAAQALAGGPAAR